MSDIEAEPCTECNGQSYDESTGRLQCSECYSAGYAEGYAAANRKLADYRATLERREVQGCPDWLIELGKATAIQGHQFIPDPMFEVQIRDSPTSWTNATTFFTKEAAEEYGQRHHPGKYRVHTTYLRHDHEMLRLRRWLQEIAASPYAGPGLNGKALAARIAELEKEGEQHRDQAKRHRDPDE